MAHCHIEFHKTPIQYNAPTPIQFSDSDADMIDKEIDIMCTKGAIVEAQPCKGQFLSNFFLTTKKDDSLRPIINLKHLNK